jgi:hypothetical protein
MDLKDYFAKAVTIERFIVDTISAHDKFAKKELNAEIPNPHYYQVESNGGLALIMYDGMPSSFGTPLGELRLGGRGVSNQDVRDMLRERLGLVEIVPKQVTMEGEFGPIMSITKDLEGNPLPQAVLRTTKKNYLQPNSEGHSSWMLTQDEIGNDGFIFRAASAAEIEGVQFSHQY